MTLKSTLSAGSIASTAPLFRTVRFARTLINSRAHWKEVYFYEFNSSISYIFEPPFEKRLLSGFYSFPIFISALRGEPCPMAAYGKSCQYMHDVEAFLSTKPPDLDSKCYQFDSFGYCPQMLHCRFGETHKEFDLQNIKNRYGFQIARSETNAQFEQRA